MIESSQSLGEQGVSYLRICSQRLNQLIDRKRDKPTVRQSVKLVGRWRSGRQMKYFSGEGESHHLFSIRSNMSDQFCRSFRHEYHQAMVRRLKPRNSLRNDTNDLAEFAQICEGDAINVRGQRTGKLLNDFIARHSEDGLRFDFMKTMECRLPWRIDLDQSVNRVAPSSINVSPVLEDYAAPLGEVSFRMKSRPIVPTIMA